MAVVWAPLESNPDTINPYLMNIGVTGLQCVDILSFDDELINILPKPQLAVILCFPEYQKVDEIMKETYEKMKLEDKSKFKDVFFMNQNISNACGTFALFHALANLDGVVDLGSGPFRKWLDSAKDVAPEERSALLANNQELATAHLNAAQEGETSNPETVNHHFICYINKEGQLYELDSRAPGPRLIGATSNETLVKDAGNACKHLMEKLNNASFAAMALAKI